MRRPSELAPAVAGAILVAVCAAGCGSTTKTVSIASPPPTQTTTASTKTSSSPATTSKAPTVGSGPAATGGATAPATTRSAPEPEFTQQEGHAEGLSAAVAVLRVHGYTPATTSDYHSGQTLRVLVGTKERSAGAFDQQAFFFVNGRYIGTDSSQPSAIVNVVSQSDTEVTLAYALYRPSDHVCCPSGGRALVRFQLNDGKLAALSPIPPVSSTTGLSRQ